MSASKPERRAVLGEDGEIRDLDSLLTTGEGTERNEPDAQPEVELEEHESIYCTRCGAENPHDASYCARCGKPLVEPGLPADEAKRKRKRDLRPGPGPGFMPGPGHQLDLNQAGQLDAAREFNVWGMISRLVMLTFVAGMVITSMITFQGRPNNAMVAPFVLLAWFLVEAVRGGKRNRMNLWSMIIEIVTMTLVTGMVITSFVFNAWALGLIALLAWFLTEAVRD